MALNFQRGLRPQGSFTVKDPTPAADAPIKEGTLCLYNQTTEAVTLVAGATYNVVTIGNGFGSEGSRVVAVAQPEPNREYWVRLGGTVTKGDKLNSDAQGRGVTGTGAFVAMSSGVVDQVIPVQRAL
jgi:hypothetical protein